MRAILRQFIQLNTPISKVFGVLLISLCYIFMIGSVVFWVYKEVFPQLLSSYIFIPLIEKYRKGNHSRISEFTLDQMQQTFKCCGIDDKKNWQENEKFNCTNDICKLPNSCCRDLMDCSVSTDQKNETTLYFNENCIDRMSYFVDENIGAIAATWGAIMLVVIFQFVCMFYMVSMEQKLKH